MIRELEWDLKAYSQISIHRVICKNGFGGKRKHISLLIIILIDTLFSFSSILGKTIWMKDTIMRPTSVVTYKLFKFQWNGTFNYGNSWHYLATFYQKSKSSQWKNILNYENSTKVLTK